MSRQGRREVSRKGENRVTCDPRKEVRSRMDLLQVIG
jgi:hypothetical protein